MKLTQKELQLIENKEVSIANFDYAGVRQDKMPLTKNDFLRQLAIGKKILHIGCVDHTFFDDRIKGAQWLHSILTECAQDCLGIDIDKDGIAKIKTKFNYDNVIYWNILTEPVPAQVKKQKWDYIFLPEVLEHIANPGEFLQALRTKLKPLAKQLVITVPNALALRNFLYALKNREEANTDHKFFFSPVTLSKLLFETGFTPLEFFFCNYNPLSYYNVREKIKNYLLKRSPTLRDVLITRGGL